MNKTTTRILVGALLCTSLALAGCGRAVNDAGPVKAMNLDSGEVKEFESEAAVPAGWGVCPDTGCEQVPKSVPCQNLGAEVCTQNPECRLRTLDCDAGEAGTSSASATPGAAPADRPADEAPAEPPTDPITPPPSCEQVCQPKDALQCNELLDQSACGARKDCEWGEGPCQGAPCASDDASCDVTCPLICKAKGPKDCQQLDEKSCEQRSDCKWELGVCPAIACADENDPGCDIKCEAFCQPNDDVPPPPPPKGCSNNDQCGKGKYCHLDQACPVWFGDAGTPESRPSSGGGSAGSSDGDNGSSDFAAPEPPEQLGTCKARPEACPELYAPVCGCDGQTYSSECHAAGSGVNVAHVGKCDQPPPPPPPGGCTSDAECGDGAFCRFELGCGFGQADPMPGGSGAAYPMPAGVCTKFGDADQGCNAMYAPVCGCDGKTYGNRCSADAAGVNIVQEGECATPPPPPPVNECWDNSGCADGQYCFIDEGCGYGQADPMPGGGAKPMPAPMGVCKTRPSACYEIYSPVCGCDGKSYGNDCEAAAAGTNVAHLGKCK